MKVVSNTSPLIFLSKIDALKLLDDCFESITIPLAVEAELKELGLPQYIQRQAISELGSYYVKGAIGSLHIGELEAIVLTQEIKADYVLLDDLSARKKAVRQGLKIMGTVGVLKLANSKKILSAKQTAKYYDALVNQHGLYLSGKIIKLLKASLI